MVPWGVRDVALQVLIRLRPFSLPSPLVSCVQSQFTVMAVLCVYAAVHDDSLLCRPRAPNLTWVCVNWPVQVTGQPETDPPADEIGYTPVPLQAGASTPAAFRHTGRKSYEAEAMVTSLQAW